MADTHYQSISRNKRRTWLIMTGFVIFVAAACYFMAVGFGFGLGFVGIGLIVSGLMSLGSYWFSDKIILGMSGAREATREKFFDYYTVTENIVASQRMPLPALYVIEDSAMNAFATGRDPDHAVVCATTGLLRRLDRSEIEGVVAHELSHIQNYDIRLMSIVSILVGLVALLSDWMLHLTFFGGGDNERGDARLQILFFVVGMLLALLAPIVAQLIKLAISRNREFLADASATGMTKNPEGLIRALQKISQDTEPLEAANKATAHLYIESPLGQHRDRGDAVGWFSGMFQTHPPVEERIAALRGNAN